MLERFTDRARRCVVVAQEEARAHGHESIGGEHLLIGVLQDGDDPAAEALRSLGVSEEGVREQRERAFAEALASIGISLDEVRKRVGDPLQGQGAPDKRPPFSPGAKNALEQSLREALLRGDDHIGGEHILLALLRDEHGPAAEAFRGLGVSTERVEERLDEVLLRREEEGLQAGDGRERARAPGFPASYDHTALTFLNAWESELAATGGAESEKEEARSSLRRARELLVHTPSAPAGERLAEALRRLMASRQ